MATRWSEIRSLLAEQPDAEARILAILRPSPAQVIRGPDDVLPLLRSLLAGRETEALVAIALDRRSRVIDAAILTTGNAGCTVVDPAHVYRWALTRKRPTTSVLLAHNHPAGDPTPSPQDREVTERVARAGSVLGVPLVDHLVVTDDAHTSLAELGCVPRPR